MMPIFNIGILASAADSRRSLFSILQNLGLTTNLKLCLDAGDEASYAGGAMTTAAGPSTLGATAFSNISATIRQVINASAISASGSAVIVTFGDDGGTFTIDKAYIGEAAAAGDTYDFATTPTQITFSGGSAGFTISGGSVISSDPITFTLDETKNYVISYHYPVGGANPGGETTFSGWSSYGKSGDDAATVDASGYSSQAFEALGVVQVDVVDSGNGGQTWTDRSSSATNFLRGTLAVPDSADPTFNGVVGSLASDTYWSFDGGDYFTVAAGANPSWVEPFHKDGATFTVMCAYYQAGTDFHGLFGDLIATTGIGFAFIAQSGVARLRINRSGAVANTFSSVATPTPNAWNIVGVSVNENGGAAAGAFSINATTETFDPAYSSPSAASAEGDLQAGGEGNPSGANAMAAGSRMGWVAAFDAALSAAEMQSIFAQTRGRFGI